MRFTPDMRQPNQTLRGHPGTPQGTSKVVADRVASFISNRNMTATKEQVKLALTATMAVADAVRELGEVNEGILYTVLCGKMDLQAFERLVAVLVGAGVVERKPMHMLKWVSGK